MILTYKLESYGHTLSPMSDFVSVHIKIITQPQQFTIETFKVKEKNLFLLIDYAGAHGKINLPRRVVCEISWPKCTCTMTLNLTLKIKVKFVPYG